MSIVNFAVPKTLDERVVNTIKQKGFASKAEFFRLAAIYFMELINKQNITENDKFDYLTDMVQNAVIQKYQNKKISSIKKQLTGI